MSVFKFKRFEIRHDKCAMKIGTDGLLLGAWTDLSTAKRVLDVGTGSGVIAIMCAQRNSNANIMAIEIDEDAAEQAMENVKMSPFAENVQVCLADFCDIALEDISSGEKFTHIVSNPPYFVEQTCSPDCKRNQARNSSALPFEDLMRKSADLLCEGGTLSIIIPASLSFIVVSCAIRHGLFLSRRTDVADVPCAGFKRSMLEFVNGLILPTERSNMYIHSIGGEYSLDYKNMMSEYLFL